MRRRYKNKKITKGKSRMQKRNMSPANIKKAVNTLTKEEFKEMLSGLTDAELNQVCDWLLNPQ